MPNRKQPPVGNKPLSPSQSLSLLRQQVRHLKAHPQQGRELMVRAGICTPDGRLTKAFGGVA